MKSSGPVHPAGTSVQPEWCTQLPLQMQSVLLLAARGADGIAKFHPSKGVQRAYRASVLKGAYYGDVLPIDDTDDNSFMSNVDFAKWSRWELVTKAFFDTVDDLPFHFVLHLVHGAEILAYKHPDEAYRYRWLAFYEEAVKDMHLTPETEAELDARLNDVFE